MREAKILLENIEKVKKFVAAASNFQADIDLVSGRYVIDAKSILGIFSMDLSKPLTMEIHAEADEAEKILEALKEYIV